MIDSNIDTNTIDIRSENSIIIGTDKFIIYDMWVIVEPRNRYGTNPRNKTTIKSNMYIWKHVLVHELATKEMTQKQYSWNTTFMDRLNINRCQLKVDRKWKQVFLFVMCAESEQQRNLCSFNRIYECIWLRSNITWCYKSLWEAKYKTNLNTCPLQMHDSEKQLFIDSTY